MDKLRAMQYFNRVVESGTFTAAARSLGVSTPSITQLIGALERSLGVALLHRTNRGMSLTPDGERYYETSRQIAIQVKDLESRLGTRGTKPRGTLTVGMRHAVARYCVMPRITRFLERFPDIEIVTKPLEVMQGFAAENLDVAVLIGWPDERELVVKPLAQTRQLVCASPEYLKRHGWPHEPEDLRNHHCLVFRGTTATLLDRWTFKKGDERRTVDVKSRLLSDDRTWLDEAACAGAGVIRFVDLTVGRYLSSGQLVPLLTEWEGLDAPVIYAIYRPSERHSKLVRVFVDFLIEVFAEIEAERALSPAGRVLRVSKPEWYGRAHGRHSEYVSRKRKRDV
jgi:DNA-binding transcriptional LysR family regulator